MARGWSLHLGVNKVDTKHYGGWEGPLAACEFDAEDMASIASARGFDHATALTTDATRRTLEEFLSRTAAEARAGDIVWISYSGHGGQVPDWNGDEEDAQDETWCLYDGQFIDDELHAAWAKYRAGVRILVLSDSCHSGTVTRAMVGRPGAGDRGGGPAFRAMPDEAAVRTYRRNRAFYDELQAKAGPEGDADAQASVLLISGCQDNQLSRDGTFNGAFTGRLLQVWRDGSFDGSYRRFHRRIVEGMASDQTPNLTLTGTADMKFLKQQPFTV